MPNELWPNEDKGRMENKESACYRVVESRVLP